MTTHLIDYGYDYITLTSFDKELLYVGRDIAQGVQEYKSPGKPKRMLGYSGVTTEGMFYGSRRQLLSGIWQEHFMVQLWGPHCLDKALIFMDHIDDLRCTRLDVQSTYATDTDEPLRETYDKAVSGGLNAKLVEQEKATVYFGSRKSQRYSRLYEKVGRDRQAYSIALNGRDNHRVIRFETEFKEKLAEVAWKALCEGSDDSFLLAYGEVGRKWVPSRVMVGIMECLQEEAQGTPPYALRGERKETDAYRFFTETILPWLRKRNEKLAGAELANVEEWIQAHFLDE